MRTITISVLPEIAIFFEKADKKGKNRAELHINAWLNELLAKQLANKRLLNTMKASSAQAKRNGFKPEMLEEILKENDE